MSVVLSEEIVSIQNRLKEYDTTFTDLMQMTVGEGFLSFGGTEFLDKMFQGIPLQGKKILDVGCGLGGPARYLAEKYDVDIIGIDIEPDVIIKAQSIHATASLKGTLSFSLVEKNDFPFREASFDLIFGNVSWLHVENKPFFFKKLFPLLKTGGYILSSDWMHTTPYYSEDLQRFLSIDELNYSLTTQRDYEKALRDAGFEILFSEDVSEFMIKEFKVIYHSHFGPLGEKIKKHYGEAVYYTILHSWLLQRLVFEKGELQSYIVRALKP